MWSRRRLLAALPLLAGALTGCDAQHLGWAPGSLTPAPTPFPTRPGDPDEVRLAIFDDKGGPPPPGPLERLLPRLSGSAAVGKLRLKMVHVPCCPADVDPDTGQFLSSSRKSLSVSLIYVVGLPQEYWPDLVLYTDLEQLRDSSRRRLIRPLDPYLAATSTGIDDPWPAVGEVCHYQGHVWAVPLAIHPLVLTYNPGWFTRAQLPLPTNAWNWDQLLRTAKRLTQPPAATVPPAQGQSSEPNGGIFGFFATAPDSLPVFVWQAGGEVITGRGRTASCALAMPAALDGQRFIFDLVHRDQVSPRQTPQGTWAGAAVMQLGPAIGTNFVLPPKGEVAATGYALNTVTCLAVTSWARDPQRAVHAALGLAAAVQGQYDWPVSQAAMEQRAQGGGPAATVLAALRMVHPPGLVADVRDAVESAAIAIANEIVRPEAATLDDQQLVQNEAKNACAAINQSLRGLRIARLD